MPEAPDLIFMATTPWDGTPLTERHLAAGLASSRRVLYVEPPVSVGRAGWRAAGGTRRVPQGLDVLTPGGCFVFNTVHNILPEVPPQNIVAMMDAVAAFGRYPSSP